MLVQDFKSVRVHGFFCQRSSHIYGLPNFK